MRFLADESCDFAVVRALRAAGHDVKAVAEISPRASDSSVIKLALDDDRILLTEDRDFGQLVYAYGYKVLSVIYMRYPASARKMLPKDVLKFLKKRDGDIIGCFIVMQPGKIRVIRIPDG